MVDGCLLHGQRLASPASDMTYADHTVIVTRAPSQVPFLLSIHGSNWTFALKCPLKG